MSGLFTTLNTGRSALRASQVGLDIAGQNLANAGVEGYTRRRVELATLGGVVPAKWSRDPIGALGVRVMSSHRLADELANSRVRTEHGKDAFLASKANSLANLESTIIESGEDGIGAQFTAMRNAFSALSDNPESDGARANLLNVARGWAGSIQSQVQRFDSAESDERVTLGNGVDEVNSLAGQLAEVNKNIMASRNSGVDVSTLEDERDQLALKLSQLTGGEGKVNDTGGIDFTIGGEALVTAATAGRLTITSGGPGDTAGTPVELTLTDPTGFDTTLDTVGGSLAASVEIVNVTIPDYLAQLSDVVTTYADEINSLHSSGYDTQGNPAGDFFAYDPADPLRTIGLAVTTTAEIAASSDPDGGYDSSLADAMAEVATGEQGYTSLVTSFASSIANTNAAARTQAIFTAQVDGAREAVSGVNTDEELLALTQYQRSYEAAARVITVADSLLDTLINRTGLTR